MQQASSESGSALTFWLKHLTGRGSAGADVPAETERRALR